VHATLELALTLRTDVGEAARAAQRESTEAADASRVEVRELLAVLRLVTSLAVCRTQLQLVDQAVEEAGEAIRARELREELHLADVAVVAAAIGAHARGHEQTLADQRLALREHAKVVHREPAVVDVANGTGDRLVETA